MAGRLSKAPVICHPPFLGLLKFYYGISMTWVFVTKNLQASPLLSRHLIGKTASAHACINGRLVSSRSLLW